MERLLALMLCAVSLGVGAQTTFNVDMACAPEFDNVFVTGPWCGWCAENGDNVMTDPDGDGIYTVVLDETVAGDIEYKYAINGFNDQENLVNDMVEGASCAPVSDYSAYANRLTTQGTVNNDVYGTCDGLCNDQPPTDVTFRVDMSGYEGSFNPANVTWNSQANNWCGNCAPMEAIGGDIYELTVPLTGDTIMYKFAIGNWSDQEDLPAGSSCTLTVYEESAPNGCCYVNRIVVLGCEDSIEMPLVCWNSCASCEFVPVFGCTDANACNYFVDATEDDGSCEYGNCDGLLNVAQVIASSADHTILAEALEVTGLTADLSLEGPLTLFAPVDDAFNGWLEVLNLVNQTNFDVSDLLAMDGLDEVLVHHLFGGSLLSTDFVDGSVAMLSGQTIDLGLYSSGVYLNDSVFISGPDVVTANGIIHSISGPLIPSQIHGCYDVNASNYSVFVNQVDNGSCLYDDNCTANEVAGCTDENACNYNADATEDDGSCFECSLCDADFDFAAETTLGLSPDPLIGETFEDGQPGQFYADVWHILVPTSAGDLGGVSIPVALDSIVVQGISLIGELGEGLSISDVGLALIPNNNGDSGNPYTLLGGNQYCATLAGVPDTAGFFFASIDVVGWVNLFGNPLSQEFAFEGYTLNLCSSGCSGCTDAIACNYKSFATLDDGSCIFPGDLCDDSNAFTENDTLSVECECVGSLIAILGCTDDNACNYDALANTDSGLCEFPGDDCDDLNDMTIDDVVNDECSCEGQELVDEGCTISIACNYNPYAINDDNSCVFICPGCTDPVACNFDAGALQEDGTCTYPEDSGWCNCEGAVSDALGICGGTCDFDQDNDGVCDDVDDCIGIVDACGICNGPGAIYPCGCDDFPEGSCSCDGLTLVDQCGVCDGDGTSCVGCTYDFACNYDPEAIIQDASQCEFGTCAGCLDPLACNYNPTVNGDDGSCEYPAFYLDCAGNCLNDANANGVCDENEIFGCAYPSACNFDPQVTADDGSCDYSCVESFCEADFDFGNESWGFSPDPYNAESFEEGTVNLAYADVLHGLFPLGAGEIDPAYPPQLPIDSVLLLQEVQEDGLIANVLFTDVETNENFFSEDLGFVLTLNNPNGGVSPQTVLPEEQFCISILGVPEREGNYQISFPFELWSTIAAPFSVSYVFEFPLSVITATIGCMDPDACNYQPTAVEDDGSCGVFDECGVCAGLGIPEGECDCDGNVVDAVGVCGGDCPSDFNANGICDSDEVFGCTYDSAENYDPEATSDDGTCVGFEGANVSSCLFDGDGNGGVGSGDLLGLLSEFGNVCD